MKGVLYENLPPIVNNGKLRVEFYLDSDETKDLEVTGKGRYNNWAARLYYLGEDKSPLILDNFYTAKLAELSEEEFGKKVEYFIGKKGLERLAENKISLSEFRETIRLVNKKDNEEFARVQSQFWD